MKGLNILRELIGRNPSITPLMKVMQPFCGVTIPGTSVCPPTGTGIPQVVVPGKLRLGPKKLGPSKFQCRECGKLHSSWSGCDTHMRREHSLVFYGPCPNCTWSTASKDGYRKHVDKCNGRKKGKVEEASCRECGGGDKEGVGVKKKSSACRPMMMWKVHNKYFLRPHDNCVIFSFCLWLCIFSMTIPSMLATNLHNKESICFAD